MDLAQWIGELTRQGSGIDKQVGPLVKATAEATAATQRQMVAKRSGRTARSIEATAPDGQPLNLLSTEAVVGPTWFVGRLLESGTSTQPARPFVAPSADKHGPQLVAEIAKVADW